MRTCPSWCSSTAASSARSPRSGRAAQRAGRRAHALRRQRGRAADPHRRALRGRRRLGGGGRPGDAASRSASTSGCSTASASSTPSARRAGRVGGATGRQHLGGLPVLWRPRLALRAAGAAATTTQAVAVPERGIARRRWRWRWRTRRWTRAMPTTAAMPAKRRARRLQPAARAAGALRSRCGAASARWPRPSAWPMPNAATWTPPSTGTQRALRAADGSASLKAAEQLGNLRARRGAGRADAAQARRRDRRRHPPAASSWSRCMPRSNARTCSARPGSAWRWSSQRQGCRGRAAPVAAALRAAPRRWRWKQAAPNLFYPVMNAHGRRAAPGGAARPGRCRARPGAGRRGTAVAAGQRRRPHRTSGRWSALRRTADAGGRGAGPAGGRRATSDRSGLRRPGAACAGAAPVAIGARPGLFVLEPYAKAAGGSEAQAANAVLKQLQSLAA